MIIEVTILDEGPDFDVQVVNTETDEREEELERSYVTMQKAYDYVQELVQDKRYVVTHKESNAHVPVAVQNQTDETPMKLYELRFYEKSEFRVAADKQAAEALFYKLHDFGVNGTTRYVEEVTEIDGYRITLSKPVTD